MHPYFMYHEEPMASSTWPRRNSTQLSCLSAVPRLTAKCCDGPWLRLGGGEFPLVQGGHMLSLLLGSTHPLVLHSL